MRSRTASTFTLLLLAIAMQSAVAAPVAPVDRAFVGKVSQGGAFEVLASRLAVDRATSPDVKAFAQNDVADHVGVNDELKAIAAAQGLPVAATLAAPLQHKLARLAKLTGVAFDRAYLGEMTAIHHKDEGIFATEAKKGADADWKAFAAKTDEIVKGHIVALDAMKMN